MKALSALKMLIKFAIFAILVPLCILVDGFGEVGLAIGRWFFGKMSTRF